MMDEEDRPPPEMLAYLRRIGKKYGALGGKATAKKLSSAQRRKRAQKAGKGNLTKLTPGERSERARKAALAMHAKKKAKAADK